MSRAATFAAGHPRRSSSRGGTERRRRWRRRSWRLSSAPDWRRCAASFALWSSCSRASSSA